MTPSSLPTLTEPPVIYDPGANLIAESLSARHVPGFRHEALFYSGDDLLVSAAISFIEEGIHRDEPILVALSESKLAVLSDRVETQSPAVSLLDMDRVGANPGLILSAWQDFVSKHGDKDRPIRGIGEPITPRRTGATLVESHHSESSLNLAFEDVDYFWLLCPYDLTSLAPEVVGRAGTTHPYLNHGGVTSTSQDFDFSQLVDSVLGDPLPEAPEAAQQLEFAASDLRALRFWLSVRALEAGLPQERTEDLVLAAHEIASNSVVHGGGGGLLLMWREDASIVCQISDRGFIDDPLLGRLPPDTVRSSGRGLWLANHLSDLLQIRSAEGQTVVRLHKSIS